MTQVVWLPFMALMDRIRYRHGLPFIMSVVFAVATIGWPPRVFRPTSIWTFALLALIATAFTLLYGGRFRTFFIAVAVMTPFLVFCWFLRLPSVMPDFPSRGVAEYFFYFVAAPILLVWIVATLLSRNERPA
jgi:hypothetical protein